MPYSCPELKCTRLDCVFYKSIKEEKERRGSNLEKLSVFEFVQLVLIMIEFTDKSVCARQRHCHEKNCSFILAY